MRQLALTLCHQLQSKFLDTASGEQVSARRLHFSDLFSSTFCSSVFDLRTCVLYRQVIKNLLFVGKVIYLLSPESEVTPEQEEEEEEEGKGRGRICRYYTCHDTIYCDILRFF